MDTREVKANLNAVVQYNGIDYMFQGCTIRKNAATNEFYYQVIRCQKNSEGLMIYEYE